MDSPTDNSTLAKHGLTFPAGHRDINFACIAWGDLCTDKNIFSPAEDRLGRNSFMARLPLDESLVDVQADMYLRDILLALGDGNPPFHCVSVDGDGNCLAHAISRSTFGTEMAWHSIRTQLKEELTVHRDYYIEVQAALPECTVTEIPAELLVDEAIESAGASALNPDLLAMDMLQVAGTHLSPLHVFGIANLLRRPIVLLSAQADFIEPTTGQPAVGVFAPLRHSPADCCTADGAPRRPVLISWANERRRHYVSVVPFVGEGCAKRAVIPKDALPRTDDGTLIVYTDATEATVETYLDKGELVMTPGDPSHRPELPSIDELIDCWVEKHNSVGNIYFELQQNYHDEMRQLTYFAKLDLHSNGKGLVYLTKDSHLLPLTIRQFREMLRLPTTTRAKVLKHLFEVLETTYGTGAAAEDKPLLEGADSQSSHEWQIQSGPDFWRPLPRAVQDLIQKQLMPMVAEANVMGVDPKIPCSDRVNGPWLFDGSRTRMIFPGRPYHHQLRYGPVVEESEARLESYAQSAEARTNTADGDQMADQLINFGFDTDAIRSAIASSAGPLNPSLEQQLDATLEILFQTPVSLDETIVESSSTAVPLIRSGSAAAYCSVLDEQKDNFTVLVTEEHRLHSQGVALPGVPDCVSWACEICTYVNESVNTHRTCDMCYSPKPVEAAPGEEDEQHQEVSGEQVGGS